MRVLFVVGRIKQRMISNYAINADGLGQRAFGASPNPPGYGER